MKRIAVIIMLIVSIGSLHAGDYYDISLSIWNECRSFGALGDGGLGGIRAASNALCQ